MEESGRLLGECAEIVGLFADIPPPRLERFTLIDCEPVNGFGGRPERMDAVVLETFVDGVRRSETWLEDVTVVGAADGRIELTGRVCRFRHEQPAYEVPPGDGFRMGPDYETTLVRFRTVEGVFRRRPELDTPPVTLLGFRPEPWFLDRMIDRESYAAAEPESTGQGRTVPLAGLRLEATIEGRASDGRLLDTSLRGIFADITAVRPSSPGAGLWDVDLDQGAYETLPTAARPFWDSWLERPPTESGTWTSLAPESRSRWLSLAQAAHRHDVPGNPPGRTYHVDGRHIADVTDFCCALGEAINGPGGYVGWDLDDVGGHLNGSAGAITPFTLIWSDAEASRQAMGEEPFQDLITFLSNNRAEVIQRRR
ncbi:barstar family protein [Actinoplanes derwentensis]|uniref:Barstar (Barnase inhibitor) n=1 Tax=Actinoplanes derwentensis TaxID=113562 RepID=A0A1H2C1L2_9ACTN|nr:barstar family protein [Actinoplanes derwentensis]GID84713.1 hypothetical protein Ade03nite_36370 [Actinoplanes derwentensis]SDT64530.1 Barstar (barnase inhibitor) [Actinoplanes derwentensis]